MWLWISLVSVIFWIFVTSPPWRWRQHISTKRTWLTNRSAWCRSPPDCIQSGGCLYRSGSHRSFHNTDLSHLISSHWYNLAVELSRDGAWHISVSEMACDTTESVTGLPRCQGVSVTKINFWRCVLFCRICIGGRNAGWYGSPHGCPAVLCG